MCTPEKPSQSRERNSNSKQAACPSSKKPTPPSSHISGAWSGSINCIAGSLECTGKLAEAWCRKREIIALRKESGGSGEASVLMVMEKFVYEMARKHTGQK
eukprot:TRINITY_DN27868_c0_g1_i2.p2 TRINITY_DN27868_c0_g1~~TRINITY_DN27868_c0_g1_i2.p2  ORF type:complete len:101 (+),score=10.39 TRINITY_DN27868_c0_g1_i2:117-419(+)